MVLVFDKLLLEHKYKNGLLLEHLGSKRSVTLMLIAGILMVLDFIFSDFAAMPIFTNDTIWAVLILLVVLLIQATMIFNALLLLVLPVLLLIQIWTVFSSPLSIIK